MINNKLSAILVSASIILAGAGYFAYTQYLRELINAIDAPDMSVVEILDRRGSYPPIGSGQSTTTMSGFPLMIPDGFFISLFAKGLEYPRVLTRDCDGNMVTSLTKSGQVVALPDKDDDGKADKTIVVRSGLKKPHGLAFSRTEEGLCILFIAEEDKVSLYDYDLQNNKAILAKKLIDLPSGDGHFTRTLAIDNGKLLVSVGSSCNVCHESDSRRASVISMDFAGNNVETYARGLRNSVFLAKHPITGKLWATEMGRDNLGDDVPPDEINILEKGKNYGWPICFGKNIHDTDFDKNTYIRNPCMEPFETGSHIDLQAHSAPLGIAFFSNEGWPEDIQGDALVAYHGSWNRSEPTGYKIVRLKLSDTGKLEKIEDFVSGFMGENGKKYGRPADVMIENGVIYFSDDSAGVIYRLERKAIVEKCIKTGCSGQVCSDEGVITDCMYKPEYQCYNTAICEMNASGNCAWRETEELKKCLLENSK